MVRPRVTSIDTPAGLFVQALAFQQKDPGQPAFVEDWEKMYQLWNRQLMSELDSVKNAIESYDSIMKGSIRRGDVTSMAPTRRLLLDWYTVLVPAIEEELQKACFVPHPCVSRTMGSCMQNAGHADSPFLGFPSFAVPRFLFVPVQNYSAHESFFDGCS